jgi:hypothetical protein
MTTLAFITQPKNISKYGLKFRQVSATADPAFTTKPPSP